MKMQKILLATDFTQASKTALRTAVHFCKKTGATLHVVHVLPEMEGRVKNVISKLANHDLQKFFPSRLYPNNRRELIYCDSTSRGILKYAKTHGCDLIVLGSKNRSGVGDFLAGSVVRKLTKISTVPVMLTQATKKSPHKIQKIFVPVDFSASSKKALRVAIQFAKLLSAEIHVIYVLDSRIPTYFAQLDSLLNKSDQRIKRLVKQQAKRLVYPLKKIKAVAIAGNPIEQISEYVTKNRIDLIVMATHHKNGLIGSLMRSTASIILAKTNTLEITI